MSEIKWSKAQRKKLHGFRTPHKADAVDAVMDVPSAWTLLKDRAKRTKLSKGPKPLQAAFELRKKGKVPDSLDVVTEVGLLELASVATDPITRWEQWAEARATVGLWVGVQGFAFAFDVILQNRPYQMMKMPDREFEMTAIKSRDACSYTSWPVYEPLYWALRCPVAHMSDEAFADACASVKKRLSKAAPKKGEAFWHRAALVYVLSRDQSIVAAQIDKMKANVESAGYNAGELLGVATTDIDQAAWLAERSNFIRYPLDFVETHGAAAKPIFEKQYERRAQHSSKQFLKGLSAGLKMVG